jgi:hypothetical protein
MTPTHTAEAARRIATLRGLYGDLGFALNDPDRRRELLTQIAVEHAALTKLIPPANDPLD